MKWSIKEITGKVLIGINLEMSLVENRTFELFSTFMPRRKEIVDVIDSRVYDLRVYKNNYFDNFSPSNLFIKWALVEVLNDTSIPQNMDSYKLVGGKYAVFIQDGEKKDPNVFQTIFTEWLPNSEYELDHRPHFEILSVSNIKNDPNGKEEIWIPVK